MGIRREFDVELKIPSDMQFIELLDTVISDVLQKIDLEEEDKAAVNLALIEAGTNAIKHGNKNDPTKDVHCVVSVEDDKLTIRIKDKGMGFDPNTLKNPLDLEHLHDASGRGIYLINVLMDEVEYDFDLTGTEIRMTKYIKKKKPEEVS
jgi:serine/threonine-protein kinase RsbW